MNYQELVQAVYNETARPDLEAETQNAVLSSVLEMHCRGEYLKDIQPSKIVFDYESYVQNLETATLPFYRKMKYFRRTGKETFTTGGMYPIQGNPQLGLTGSWGWWGVGNGNPLFTGIEADDILDIFGDDKLNVMYQAGHGLYIKSATPFQYAEAAWLTYPNCDITGDGSNFNSWIAREFPWCIVFNAAAYIFAVMGRNDTAAQYNSPNGGKVTKWLDILDKNNITI